MCVALCFFPIVTAMLDAHCNCIPTDKERGGRSPRPLQGETARHSSPAVVTLPYDARCAAVCCPSWRTGPRLRPREMHAKNGHRISREFWELPLSLLQLMEELRHSSGVDGRWHHRLSLDSAVCVLEQAPNSTNNPKSSAFVLLVPGVNSSSGQ